jgi:hypothetical protein
VTHPQFRCFPFLTPLKHTPTALHGISPEEVHARVSHFLKHQLSVTLVLDISLGQALALTETAAEFVAR